MAIMFITASGRRVALQAVPERSDIDRSDTQPGQYTDIMQQVDEEIIHGLLASADEFENVVSGNKVYLQRPVIYRR
jgi:hypothetical protein